MAWEQEVEKSRRTWHAFTRGAVVTSVIVIVTLAGMAFFLL